MTAHDKLDDMKNSSKSNYLKKRSLKQKEMEFWGNEK